MPSFQWSVHLRILPTLRPKLVTPFFFGKPPLNLQVVRAALFWQFPLYIIFRESPLKIGFLGEPPC